MGETAMSPDDQFGNDLRTKGDEEWEGEQKDILSGISIRQGRNGRKTRGNLMKAGLRRPIMPIRYHPGGVGGRGGKKSASQTIGQNAS